MASHRKTSPPQLSLLRKGALALLKRDFPAAVSLFSSAYRSSHWEKRDAAVTGLGDILDSRIIEQNKLPAILACLHWTPPKVIIPPRHRVSDERLLVLLDQFMQPVLWKPRTLNEQKILLAFRTAEQTLEHILLNDAHHLVRFSALIILTDLIGEERRPLILPTLEKAHRQEHNPMLKRVLARFLK